MRKAFLMCTVALGAFAYAHSAEAYTISSPAVLNAFDFGTSPNNTNAFLGQSATSVNGVTFAYSGSTTGVYTGNRTTPPGGTGGFTSPFDGSGKNYLAVQPNGSITMTFATLQTSFALVWGTIDSYNNLVFTFSGGGAPLTLSGTAVADAIGRPNTGTIGANVLISGLDSFRTVTATDDTFSAFEFDPASVPVPEPVSLALLGTGLVGLGFARKRSRGAASA